MVEKMREFQTLRGGKAESYNPKLTAARAKLAKIKAELAADLTANSVSTSQLIAIFKIVNTGLVGRDDPARRTQNVCIPVGQH